VKTKGLNHSQQTLPFFKESPQGTQKKRHRPDERKKQRPFFQIKFARNLPQSF